MTRSGGYSSSFGRNRDLYGRRRPNRGRSFLLFIIAAAVILGGYALVSRACGGEDCTKPYCATSRKVPAPEGFELASKLFAYNTSKGLLPPGNDIQVQLPLTKAAAEARNLSFYRYAEATRTWEPLAAAVPDQHGKTATAVLNTAPPFIAIMRRLSSAGHVVAYLERNATLHHSAVGRITMVHTLDFRPSTDGGVDGELSQTKFDAGVAHYPAIVATEADKGLTVVTGMLANTNNRSLHVQQIVKKAVDLKLAGVDIAYLDLKPDQRTAFTLFIQELSQALRNQGKVLTLTLPPPQKLQDRVDEGAYDWQELGKNAEALQIAPYRDQSTYRLNMPEILEYLAAKVDPARLVLTVTPYATEKSPDGVRRLTLIEAMNIATQLRLRGTTDSRITTGSNVQIAGVNIDRDEQLTGLAWDTTSATVAFTYKLGGGRTIWLENFFSVGFKLELVSRFKLGGVAVEDAGENVYLGDIWPALLPFVTSGQPILMQPNVEDLKPRWKASKGTLEGGQRGVVRWTAPTEPGDHTVQLTLSDGVYLFESEIRVTVQPRDTRTPAASATP